MNFVYIQPTPWCLRPEQAGFYQLLCLLLLLGELWSQVSLCGPVHVLQYY